MNRRSYYSARTGKLPDNAKLDLQTLKKLFLSIYNKLEEEGYFQKYFGYWCVDEEDVKGELGSNIDAEIFLHLRKENLWPINQKIENYSEDDLFDIIEFIHDYTSRPLEGDYHRFNDCGMHYHKFDDAQGKEKFRNEVNDILKDYNEGYEVEETGEIFTVPDSGLETILNADIPSDDKKNISNKIEAAKLKFRRRSSSWEDRRDALRDLADVLEFLREDAKKLLTKPDEADLFNLANNFGIRHHNAKQKTDYDEGIWFSWIFYYYLSTIHALLRLKKKSENE